MRKIKNFKINIRPREISRILRKLLNITELDIDVEESVQRACFFYGKCIKPAVVYDTFSKETAVFSFIGETPSKWIAVSPFILTIGNALKEEFDSNRDIFGEYTTQIVSAISADTLEQSKNFVQKLIASEAGDENCELSRHLEISSNFYHDVFQILPVEKINVTLSEDGKFKPSYSAAGLFYWIPLKKRSKK
ncbi:MAG: hypothetical protein VB017_02815 [Endomicrobiaceae bacterium]|nr:hypothetical protein [Endomicrobiaceae bacterium]